MKMSKNISKFKKENVKKAIIKGEQRVTHSNKLIAAKKLKFIKFCFGFIMQIIC